MKALNYKRLLEITNTVPSFRGNVNRFPIGERRQNNKYFLRRDEDGHTVFDIVNGDAWITTEIDRLAYIQLKLEDRKFRKVKGVGKKTPHPMKWTKHTTNEQGHYVELKRQFEYFRRDKDHNIVGTVRPDNSFEFTKSRYWQGDRCFLSQSSAGWFSTDSRRGGMVFGMNNHTDGNAVFHAIWKGMRVNCDTMEAITPYEVVIHHVDRKSGKGILSKYEHMFKVSEVMLKAMDLNLINSTCMDIVDGIFGVGEHKKHISVGLLEHAEKLIEDAPLDALLLFTLAHDVRHVGYRMRYGMNNHSDDTPENIFMATKRKIAREVYKENPDILKEVSCGSGKRYPACDWGVKVMVNGQQVEQST